MPGGQTVIAADPADQRIVAWCTNDGIDVSTDGAIRHIPTGGVANWMRTAHELPARYTNLGPACADVMALGGGRVLAAFSGGLSRHGGAMPPVFTDAYETRDDGRAWTPLPAPPAASAASFGGFRDAGSAAEAIYFRADPAGVTGESDLRAELMEQSRHQLARGALRLCAARRLCDARSAAGQRMRAGHLDPIRVAAGQQGVGVAPGTDPRPATVPLW